MSNNKEKRGRKKQMIATLMIRLLPVQILFAAVGLINSIISSYFASNYVGVDAMCAVGLYGPLQLFVGAISTIFLGGAALVCGKYIGQSDRDEVQGVFTFDMIVCFFISVFFTVVLLVLGVYDLTGIFSSDPVVRPLFNRYIIGQAVGIIPYILGNQLTVFLSLENKQKLSVVASSIFVVSNLFFNYLFVQVLGWEAFGLSFAASLGLWLFCIIELLYFISGKSYISFAFNKMKISFGKEIISKGFPGALSSIYQTARGFLVNYLILTYVGSIGVSAFATANNFMNLFWSVPAGMLAVSRLLISIGMGEEDRHALTSVMKFMFTRYLAMQAVISLGIVMFSIPITGIFYQDPSDPVFMMTAWGFRILPLCMPFSIICMHFTCYGQAASKHVLINILAAVDGVLGVGVCSILLIKQLGLNAIYIANVLNGVITTIIIILYSILNNKRIARTMADLMVIPDDFGVVDDDVMEIVVTGIDEVSKVSQEIQTFCEQRGVDHKRAMLAGLAMEEMAGNVVEHGFNKDKRKHSVDIKTIYKDGDVTLRIKDDCIAFDPASRNGIDDTEDLTKNIGIRMIYKMANDVSYLNVLGLNVLAIKI
ncbi:MATE family efflux transporter [Butyrivibrio sp. JL13D10]|uniref:MATE family efflux transporter n=1 Tax=Butyrivibrio sp. JL13D10 TaxID=3236815 RepID=UPI0038B6505E